MFNVGDLLNRNKRLKEIGLLSGSTDWHSHILPGVDDGIPHLADSLAVLSYYELLNIKEVWLTPHIMEEMPNTTDKLRAKFDELLTHYKGSIKLHLAAENMLDDLFEKRLEAGDLLPIGPEKDHLLVETGFYVPMANLYTVFEKIQDAGYQPVLAHPERYGYMSDGDYDRLKSLRVKFQLNIMSLAGAYGKSAQDVAQKLLSRGYYNLYGSDLHRLDYFIESIERKALKQTIVEAVLKLPTQIGQSHVAKK